MSTLDDIYNETLKGNHKAIVALVKKAIKEGIPAHDMVNKALTVAMGEIGDRFSASKAFMPEMLLSAKTMKTAMKELQPLLKGDPHIVERGTIVIGAIKGDLHDIGKNLVITMAEGQGFKVIDLGINVEYSKFVKAINEHHPQIVAFSGLVTTTLVNIPDHIKAIEDAGLRDQVVLAIGGAPVTREFADRAGIEIYADDAPAAAKEFAKFV